MQQYSPVPPAPKPQNLGGGCGLPPCSLAPARMVTALLLFITVAVSTCIATAERSFSKLKLLMSYIRSSMKHERLTNLATLLSIETELAHTLDYNDVIETFASLKARKVNL